MTDSFALLVVAKAPVPGLAKTRLTPPATPNQAAGIAAASLLDTMAAVLATPGAIPVVALTGDLALAVHAARLRAVLGSVRVIEQRGTGFADRLANAHADLAALLPGRPVVQIGMDTPQVTPALLAGLAARLDRADSVLAPAADGGWWALGLRDPLVADCLRVVPMSRSTTAASTLAALVAKGCAPHVGAELSDVDTMADAARVAETVPGSRFAAAVAMVADRVVVGSRG